MVLHLFTAAEHIRAGAAAFEQPPILVASLPIFNGRVPHLHGHLIHGDGAPFFEHHLVEQTILGHDCWQHPHECACPRHHRGRHKGGLKLDPFVAEGADALHLLAIVGGNALVTGQHHGLQTFRPHHGPKARPRCHAPVVGGHPRNQGDPLPGRPNTGNAQTPPFPIFPEVRLRLHGVLAPDPCGIPDLCPMVINMQVDRSLADTPHKDTVVTAMLYGGGKGATAVGIAPASGQRRLPHQGPTPGKKTSCPRQKPRHKPKHVVRPQGVCPRRNMFVKHVGSQPHTREITLINLIRDCLFGNLSSPEIHNQHLARVPLTHNIPLTFQTESNPWGHTGRAGPMASQAEGDSYQSRKTLPSHVQCRPFTLSSQGHGRVAHRSRPSP